MLLPRAEAGVCARRRTYLLLSRQKNVGQEKATPLPVSPPARWANGAACDARSWGAPRNSLRSANSAQTSAASQITKRVCPAAHAPPQLLRFSARSEGGGSGLHSGHCFARPVVLRCARLARALAPKLRQRAARPDTRRGCAAAAAPDSAPHPCWLRREAQGLGWVRVPKDTRTSSSGLPQLFERSLAKGQTQ